MWRLISIRLSWQIGILGAFFLLWFGLSSLVILGWGDPEAFLRKTVGRHARADAFEFVNRGLILFWPIHSTLLLLAIEAVRLYRSDVLTMMLIGPAIAMALCALGQDWFDPNWFIIITICSICWLVGTVVSGCYWVLKPRESSA